MSSLASLRYIGRAALISGGGTGIGAAIAEQFAAEGAYVAICGRRTHVLEEQAAKMHEAGFNVLAVHGDVSEDAERIVAQVVERCGRLDVLVNNAAVSAGHDLDAMTPGAWRHVLGINLDGAFELVRAALPHLAAVKGCVLNISSISAIVGELDDVAYATSKAALEGLSRRLAVELAPLGIRCNVIRPGLIRTAAFDGMPEDFFASQLPLIPLHQIGAPEDIARAAAFLCSDDAGFITGAVLTVDGGESAR